ncbi:hypothetical protein LN050_03345 [Comamonadaceae bacterium M7527]|nr:hypothetical protein LN050_03345 [Comamonadaceae bacterium M7527]
MNSLESLLSRKVRLLLTMVPAVPLALTSAAFIDEYMSSYHRLDELIPASISIFTLVLVTALGLRRSRATRPLAVFTWLKSVIKQLLIVLVGTILIITIIIMVAGLDVVLRLAQSPLAILLGAALILWQGRSKRLRDEFDWLLVIKKILIVPAAAISLAILILILLMTALVEDLHLLRSPYAVYMVAALGLRWFRTTYPLEDFGWQLAIERILMVLAGTIYTILTMLVITGIRPAQLPSALLLMAALVYCRARATRKLEEFDWRSVTRQILMTLAAFLFISDTLNVIAAM